MTKTWSRAGVQFKARSRFDPTMHPRDAAGRFIETGATVTISPIIGGGQGTVVANAGNGYIQVTRSNGQQVRVHRSYLTVVARPDGAPPTTNPRDAAPQPVQAAPDATGAPAAAPDGAGGTGVPVTKYRHPVTGEQVAPVKAKRGPWYMVNPALVDVSGREHVAAYSLASDGAVGQERELRPADSFDLSSVGTFPGKPQAQAAGGKTASGQGGAAVPAQRGRAGPLPGAGGDPLEPWHPVFSDSDLAHMRGRTGELKFGPPSGLNAEEKEIAKLLGMGHDFRSAYAEVFGIDPDDLALMERASLIDVDRIVKATGDPAKRRLYEEFVYLSWIEAVRKGQNRSESRPQTKASPGGAEIPQAAITEAALAGQFAAASGLPPTACPFDPAGPPVTAAQAVAFVHAYVTAARRKNPSEGTVSP